MTYEINCLTCLEYNTGAEELCVLFCSFFNFQLWFQFSKKSVQIISVCQRYVHILKLNVVYMQKTKNHVHVL